MGQRDGVLGSTLTWKYLSSEAFLRKSEESRPPQNFRGVCFLYFWPKNPLSGSKCTLMVKRVKKFHNRAQWYSLLQKYKITTIRILFVTTQLYVDAQDMILPTCKDGDSWIQTWQIRGLNWWQLTYQRFWYWHLNHPCSIHRITLTYKFRNKDCLHIFLCWEEGRCEVWGHTNRW